MVSVALIWQINQNRYQLAEKAAATVPSSIQHLFKNPDVHTKRPMQTLEKIAKLLQIGADNLEVIANLDHALNGAAVEDQDCLPDMLGYPLLQANQTDESTARRNLILIGDSMDALKMEASNGRDVVLRIGVLKKDNEQLDAFLARCDIVITHEQSMDLPLRILDEIERATSK